MPRARSGWLRRLLIVIAAIAALLVAVIAVAPLFVDVHFVKQAIERRISEVAGGEVRYESLDVALFPQPHAEVHNATIRIPGALDGRIGRLEIRIALWPLLSGKVRPVAVDIGEPVLEVTIEPGGGGGGDPLATYRAALGPLVDALVHQAKGVSLGITDGKLDILYAKQRVLSLSGLAAQAQVAAGAIDASASASADLWRTLDARLKIVPGSLAATGQVQVGGLRLAEVLQATGLQGEVRVLSAAIDATVDAETDGRESVRTVLTGTAPGITVARGARTLELGAVRAALDARRDGAALTLSLTQLQLGELVPAATGALRAKPDGAMPSVELQVPALDLARLRSALLAIAGDVGGVRATLAFIPTGAAQGLTAIASGGDFASLAALGSIRAETRLAAAALDLPAQGIALTAVAGRLVLAEGKLRGSELAGTIGRSTFTRGTLAVDLAPAAALRGIGAAIDADLTEALAIVRRLIGKREPRALADVESLQGRASGHIAYEAAGRQPRVAVALDRIRGTGRHRGMPLPVTVKAGALRYEHDRVAVSGLTGHVGRSSIQAGTLDLALSATVVRAASGEAVVDLDEFYPWLKTIQALQRPTSAIPSATGTVAVRLVRLAGPLDGTGVLDYEAVLRPQQVRFAGPVLPAPLTVVGGEVRLTPHAVALDRFDGSMLDARVVASGSVLDYDSAQPRFEFALTDGRVGERGLDWARTQWQLPARAMPRSPITLATGRLQRSGGADAPLLAQGTLGLAGGVSAQFDLTSQPGHLDLRRLTMKDPDTDSTLTLKWARSAAEVAFRGHFDNRTLARVLAEPPEGQGALRGDFRATIDLAEPLRSSANGSLEGERIDALERWGIPVTIDRVRLEVVGDVVHVRESALAVAGERLAVTGAITRQAKTFGLDLRVTADTIDAERLLGAFPRDRAKPAGGAWNLPVDGRVSVDAKSVAYRAHTLSPLSGVVTLAPERIVADVKEARLCGIALPLNAVIVPGQVDLTGAIRVRAQPLVETAACLFGDHIAMTGTLDGDVELSASGPADQLARTAHGTFRFTGRNGRFQKAPGLARILALEPIAVTLQGRPGDVMAQGLDYSELVVAGTFQGLRANVTTGTLNAAAIALAMTGEVDFAARRLDMHGIVAPLGRVQSVLQHVPVIGQIVEARAIGVPMTVRGDLRDPTVVPLGPAAIGQSLVNLLGAVVKMPVDLFDPLVGGFKRAPE